MPDYSKAKIYKIVDNTSDKCYVGSTCEPTLARRLAKHVSDYRYFLNGKGHNITSFKIIENGNYDIQLIEAFPCETKDQLHAREGYWIKQTECVNKIVVGRTRKQHYEQNKELIIQKSREYREKNKELINQKKKDYREQNRDRIQKKFVCPCGGRYIHNNASSHKKSIIHKQYEFERYIIEHKPSLDDVTKYIYG
jgi:hypothetical protein